MNFELNTTPKTEAELDREYRRGMALSIVATAALFAAALGAALLLSSCTLTVSPDGTRAYTADGEQIGRAIRVIAEK